MSVSGPADGVAMSVDPLTASDQRKRTPRKRAKRLAEDGGGYVAPVPSEEKSFRVCFLSRETGIDSIKPASSSIASNETVLRW